MLQTFDLTNPTLQSLHADTDAELKASVLPHVQFYYFDDNVSRNIGPAGTGGAGVGPMCAAGAGVGSMCTGGAGVGSMCAGGAGVDS